MIKYMAVGCMIVIVFLSLTASGAGAEPQHANTDWFQKAGCGVFVHCLEGIQNNPDYVQSLGKKTSWDECVRA